MATRPCPESSITPNLKRQPRRYENRGGGQLHGIVIKELTPRQRPHSPPRTYIRPHQSCTPSRKLARVEKSNRRDTNSGARCMHRSGARAATTTQRTRSEGNDARMKRYQEMPRHLEAARVEITEHLDNRPAGARCRLVLITRIQHGATDSVSMCAGRCGGRYHRE